MTPIVYEYTLDLRFADLDQYGHLNSARYLDLVNTSRMLYMDRHLDLPTSKLAERDFGFYMTRVTQKFLKPVVGFQKVRVASYVDRVKGAKLFIPYRITDTAGEVVYSTGELEYVSIRLGTKRPIPTPAWMMPYLYES